MKMMGRWTDPGHPDSLLEMMSVPLSNNNQDQGLGALSHLNPGDQLGLGFHSPALYLSPCSELRQTGQLGDTG